MEVILGDADQDDANEIDAEQYWIGMVKTEVDADEESSLNADRYLYQTRSV